MTPDWFSSEFADALRLRPRSSGLGCFFITSSVPWAGCDTAAGGAGDTLLVAGLLAPIICVILLCTSLPLDVPGADALDSEYEVSPTPESSSSSELLSVLNTFTLSGSICREWTSCRRSSVFVFSRIILP